MSLWAVPPPPSAAATAPGGSRRAPRASRAAWGRGRPGGAPHGALLTAFFMGKRVEHGKKTWKIVELAGIELGLKIDELSNIYWKLYEIVGKHIKTHGT